MNPSNNGLSHQIRLALLSRRLPTIARIYDALWKWDVTEATAGEIVELCQPFQIAPKTVYTALKLNLGIQAPLFLKRPANAKRGRPHALYICLTEKQLSSLLDHTHCRDYYDMPHTAMLSNTAYRAGVYHFHIANAEGEYKRAQLAKMLGVTPRTAQKLDSIAHVKAEPQYKIVQFDLAQLPTDERELPGNFFLHISETGERKPANRRSYQKALERGHTCLLMKRILNWYSIDYSHMAEDFFPQTSDVLSINTETRKNGEKKI